MLYTYFMNIKRKIFRLVLLLLFLVSNEFSNAQSLELDLGVQHIVLEKLTGPQIGLNFKNASDKYHLAYHFSLPMNIKGDYAINTTKSYVIVDLVKVHTLEIFRVLPILGSKNTYFGLGYNWMGKSFEAIPGINRTNGYSGLSIALKHDILGMDVVVRGIVPFDPQKLKLGFVETISPLNISLVYKVPFRSNS